MTDPGAVASADIAGTLMSVLDISELFEMVCSKLDKSLDVFKVMNINRRTRSLVLETKSLRKELFLHQDHTIWEGGPLWKDTVDWDQEPNTILAPEGKYGKEFRTTLSADPEFMYKCSWEISRIEPSISGPVPDRVRWEHEDIIDNFRAEIDESLNLSFHRFPTNGSDESGGIVPSITLDMVLTNKDLPIHIRVALSSRDEGRQPWANALGFAPAGARFRDVLAWAEKFAKEPDAAVIEVGGIVELTEENYGTLRA